MTWSINSLFFKENEKVFIRDFMVYFRMTILGDSYYIDDWQNMKEFLEKWI